MTARNRKTQKQEMAVHARQEIGTITEQLSALAHMTVAELKTKYQDLFGEASRSFNKDYLRKKIAWRIQEIDEAACPNGQNSGLKNWQLMLRFDSIKRRPARISRSLSIPKTHACRLPGPSSQRNIKASPMK